MRKSIIAVAGSYSLSILLVAFSDPILTRLFPEDYIRGHVPSGNALITSTAFFVAISIFCAWICARYAPSRPALHVIWFFVLGEVLGVATTIPQWDKGWPHWYYLAWLLTWPISCYIGLAFGRRDNAEAAAGAASGK